MGFIQRSIEENESIQLFRDATKTRKQKNKIRKNKERSLKRAIIAL